MNNMFTHLTENYEACVAVILFAIGMCMLLFDKNLITIKDTGVDHTVPLDTEHKTLLIRHEFCRNREISLDILYCEDRLSRCYSTNKRYIDNLSAGKIEIIVDDLDRSGLGCIPADISVLLKGFQMRMHRRCGFQMNCFTNFSYGRREASVQDFVFDIIQNLLLF